MLNLENTPLQALTQPLHDLCHSTKQALAAHPLNRTVYRK